MLKKNIHIDQYFKAPLQNFEGQANEGMFDAIKDKMDDTSKVNLSVDDFFKTSLFGLEGNADDTIFDAIKAKVDASKTSVDSYFKEALQDYNSYALPIPFSEIKSKLDRDRQIDANFKNALQNYQGVAHDKEFALIRNRVLQIQNKRKRIRYAWLLLVLLIPAWYSGMQLSSRNKNAAEIKNELSKGGNNDGELLSNNSILDENAKITYDILMGNLAAKQQSKNVNSSIVMRNIPIQYQPSNSHKKELQAKVNNELITQTKSEISGSNNLDKEVIAKSNTEEFKKEGQQLSHQLENVETPETYPSKSENTKHLTIRKPKPRFTLQVFAAGSQNGRFLNADREKYLEVRNTADQITTRFNVGADFHYQYKKIFLGFGLHQNNFGQQGTYKLVSHLHDSLPLYNPQGQIIGYFPYNYRDTTSTSNYHNDFTAIELPLHFSYQVGLFSKFEFEVGATASISYLLKAEGLMPSVGADALVNIKDHANDLNKFALNGSVEMKLNYNLNSKWQLGTQLYSRSNITSLYKKKTGINELPYAFGMRWGIGFKF